MASEEIEGVSIYPDSWGMPIRHVDKRWYAQIRNGVPEKDIKLLRELREEFSGEFQDMPVPYKGYIEERFVPNKKNRYGLNTVVAALHRLQAAGLTEKFAKQFHTQSGRVEYISWYIWEDLDKNPIARSGNSVTYLAVE